MTQYKILALLGMLLFSFMGGWKVHAWKTDADIVAQYELKDKIIAELTQKNSDIADSYHKVSEQINKNKSTIVKEVKVYVPIEVDSKCVVNNGAQWLWNMSTKADSIGSAFRTNAESGLTIDRPDQAGTVNQDSGIKLSEVIEAGATNNQTALKCFERLSALQKVIMTYQDLTKDIK